MSASLPAYAELHCVSNHTYLRGASHPEELVARAAALGYTALAITDECSLGGVVRAHRAAREHGLSLIVGTELRLHDGPRLVLLAADRDGYGDLCELISRGRRAADKGCYRLYRQDVERLGAGVLAVLLPDEEPALEPARWLAGCFPGRAWVGCALLRGPDDGAHLATVQALDGDGQMRTIEAEDLLKCIETEIRERERGLFGVAQVVGDLQDLRGVGDATGLVHRRRSKIYRLAAGRSAPMGPAVGGKRSGAGRQRAPAAESGDRPGRVGAAKA